MFTSLDNTLSEIGTGYLIKVHTYVHIYIYLCKFCIVQITGHIPNYTWCCSVPGQKALHLLWLATSLLHQKQAQLVLVRWHSCPTFVCPTWLVVTAMRKVKIMTVSAKHGPLMNHTPLKHCYITAYGVPKSNLPNPSILLRCHVTNRWSLRGTITTIGPLLFRKKWVHPGSVRWGRACVITSINLLPRFFWRWSKKLS